VAPVDNPLDVFFDLVPTGAALYAPLYDEAGELVDFRFARLNPAGQRLLGLPAQPSLTFREYFPNSVPTGIFAQYRTAYLTGIASTYDVPYAGDGLDTYFRLVAQRSGELLVVNFTDMAELPQSAVEQSLRESRAEAQAARREAEIQRQRFHDVLLQMPAHIAIHEGPNQVFTLVNPDYKRIANDRDLVGQPIRKAWPELESQGILDVLDRVYQTGEPFIANEIPVQADFTRTGKLEQVYYNFFFKALRNAQGEIHGVLNFSYDVTALVLARQQVEQLNQELEARVRQRTHQLEEQQQQVQDLNEELATINEELTDTNEELHESNTRLTRTNADLDTFVYTASHDLKSPITNIEGLLLALQEALPAEAQQNELVAQLLTLLHETVARFRLTITHLTDLVRLQQSQQGPVEPVMLAPVLGSVWRDLATEIQAAGATVHANVPADVWVSFAPANVRSIVYNLLSNAVKYRAPDRPAQVWVEAERQAGAVVLRVRDNGLGLDETQQRRLFQVFQRLHTHVEGTGVGLYMIKRLIENGGATIAVSSEPGVGTTFTVTFRA
jgi:signal transduction histidine kinase